MKINSFKELIVWQRGMELVRAVYEIILPPAEQYGLQSQIRRAAVSIPSNIAEGKKRRTRKDFLLFLSHADGSAAELETQLLLISSIYPSAHVKRSLELLDEVQRMLTTMIQKLRTPTSSKL